LHAYDRLRQKECDSYDRLFVYVLSFSPTLFADKKETIFYVEGNTKTKSYYIALIIWLSKV